MVIGRFLGKTGLGRGLGMGEQGIPPPNDLITLPASALCYVDVTDTGSYVGGQRLINRVASPADSSASADYDFYLGTNTGSEAQDPIFEGSLGSPSAAVRFSGEDQRLSMLVNTVFMNSIHQSDEASLEWTILISAYWPSLAGAVVCGTGYAPGRVGFQVGFQPAQPAFLFSQYHDIGVSDTELEDGVFTEDQWSLYAFGIDKSSGTDGIMYTKINDQAQASVALTTFGTSTGEANRAFQVSGVDGIGSFPMDVRVKAILMFNERLTNAQIEAIRTQLATLHGVSYT